MNTAELLGTAAEVDLDTVMMMDALVAGPITRYLCSLVGCPSTSVLSVTRSANRAGRETDIHIDLADGLLLIENKVDAAFQPDQARSYALEVERRRAEGGAAWAVVVFPRRRTPEVTFIAGDYFDARVAIEDLIDHVEWGDDDLSAASRIVLWRTLQPKLGPEVDPERSAWGEGYRALVADLWPTDPLMIGKNALRTRTASFVQFLGPGIGERGWLSHHIEEGEVEAGLYGRRPDPATVPANARIRTKNAIRARVPVMTFSRPAAEQRVAVLDALDVVRQLHAWLLAHPAR